MLREYGQEMGAELIHKRGDMYINNDQHGSKGGITHVY